MHATLISLDVPVREKQYNAEERGCIGCRVKMVREVAVMIVGNGVVLRWGRTMGFDLALGSAGFLAPPLRRITPALAAS